MQVGKTGVIVCHHCTYPCEHEHIQVTHRFIGERQIVVLDFCSAECQVEFFWDERIQDEVRRRLKGVEQKMDKEIRWFHAHGLCPMCKRRILEKLTL